MKKKDFLTEIEGLSLEELEERSRQLSEELMKLRFRKKTGQLEQTHLLREIRRQRASVETYRTIHVKNSHVKNRQAA